MSFPQNIEQLSGPTGLIVSLDDVKTHIGMPADLGPDATRLEANFQLMLDTASDIVCGLESETGQCFRKYRLKAEYLGPFPCDFDSYPSEEHYYFEQKNIQSSMPGYLRTVGRIIESSRQEDDIICKYFTDLTQTKNIDNITSVRSLERSYFRLPYDDDYADKLEITYSAGYNDTSNIPNSIKLAVLAFVAHLYANRGSTLAPDSGKGISNDVISRVLAKYNLHRLSHA